MSHPVGVVYYWITLCQSVGVVQYWVTLCHSLLVLFTIGSLYVTPCWCSLLCGSLYVTVCCCSLLLDHFVSYSVAVVYYWITLYQIMLL